jgi:hypothetical protein
MGLVLASIFFLLGIGWIFAQAFVFVPIQIISTLESLSFYIFLVIGILFISWIVGD